MVRSNPWKGVGWSKWDSAQTDQAPGGPKDGSEIACNGGVGEARAWRSVLEASGAHMLGCRLALSGARSHKDPDPSDDLQAKVN